MEDASSKNESFLQVILLLTHIDSIFCSNLKEGICPVSIRDIVEGRWPAIQALPLAVIIAFDIPREMGPIVLVQGVAQT